MAYDEQKLNIDDKKNNAAEFRGVLWASILPVVLGALLFIAFYSKIGLGEASASIWHQLSALGLLLILSLIAATGVRFIMEPLVRHARPPSTAPTDPTDLARNRIAPFVLGLGGAAIIVLTLALVLSFALLAMAGSTNGSRLGPLAGKIDTILLGIFGAVLPILATWVGTIIAFYFTSESYRQAATVAMEASGGQRNAGPKVTSIMMSYEEIRNKVPVVNRTDADKVKIAQILSKMDEGVTRVMIFEKKAKNPVYIIRKKLIPEDLKAEADADVEKYRSKSPDLAADSKRFGFLAETATALDARRTMQDNRFEDIFVTRAGQPTEEVLGWISDDMVKGI